MAGTTPAQLLQAAQQPAAQAAVAENHSVGQQLEAFHQSRATQGFYMQVRLHSCFSLLLSSMQVRLLSCLSATAYAVCRRTKQARTQASQNTPLPGGKQGRICLRCRCPSSASWVPCHGFCPLSVAALTCAGALNSTARRAPVTVALPFSSFVRSGYRSMSLATGQHWTQESDQIWSCTWAVPRVLFRSSLQNFGYSVPVKRCERQDMRETVHLYSHCGCVTVCHLKAHTFPVHPA